MPALIAFICITLGVAIAAASFVYGRQIGYVQRNAELAEEKRKATEAHLHQAEQELQQLAYMYETEMKDRKSNTAQRPTGWNPGDMLNSAERM